MRLAYADPPYLGCGRRYGEHPDAKRWDDPTAHAQLIRELDTGYDGWALSMSAASLPILAPSFPAGTRIGAWVKPFSAFKKHVRIAYGWEPVLFRPARPNNDPDAPQTRDWIATNMTRMRGTIGAKPEPFIRWILALLGYLEGDTLDDLFPGSGIVGRIQAQQMLL